MKINELFDKDVFDKWEKSLDTIDSTYNSEAYDYRKKEEKTNNTSNDATSIVTSHPKEDDDELFTNKPTHRDIASPGYRGFKAVYKRSR